MSVSNERTVVLGLMSYIDEKGAYRTAPAGAVVKVHPDQLERFDRLNVLMPKPEFAQEAAVVEVESSAEELAGDAGEGQGEGDGGDGSNPDAEKPSDSWTIAQLSTYADAHSIDLGEATKKADILAVIQAATGKDA
ncbi:hypothetical protein [Nocardia xishanensis]